MMAFPQSLRSLLPLVAGLVVGVVGATLFSQSMPGSEGSAEERANKLEVELKRVQNQLAALNGGGPQERSANGIIGRMAGTANRRALADGTRRIAEDLREGRPVSPEDIFKASQPLMRDLAPLFDRMRMKQQKQMIDSMTGELARKYKLTPEKQQVLKQWFEEKSAKDAKQWSDMMAKDSTRLVDVMKASRNVRPDEGMETVMQSILSPEQQTAFNAERIAQRTDRVQQEADRQVQRLDSIATLDAAQRDQVFGIMARSSPDYDPSMGLGGTASATTDREAATLAVLRPDQRAAYEAETQRRRAEASKSMEEMGLALPQNWSLFNDDFR